MPRTCASPSSSASRRWWAASRTDIVVLVGKFAHVQLWIGSDDKLPRMARAIFLEDPARYRHTVQFSDWKIDPPLAADAFAFTAPAGTIRIPFAPPGATEKGK